MNRNTMSKYPKLKLLMVDRNLEIIDLARLLKRTDPSTREKVNGKTPLYLDEAILVRDSWFPEMTLDEIFVGKK